jgi:calcium binding protein 39
VPGVWPLLLPLLPLLPFEARKDTASIFSLLLRSDVGSFPAYVEAHYSLILPPLVLLHSLPSTALSAGAMVREAVRAPRLYDILLTNTPELWLFFDVYVHLPNFDVASDAFSTLRDLLTRDKAVASKFLNASYDKFFAK